MPSSPPKGRALGAHIAAVYDRVDGILLKIQRAVGGLVAHHVQMALQDQARLLLVSGCGRCLDEHIAHLVLTAGKAVGLGELHAVVAQCLFVVGGVRNAADLLKVIKTEAGSRLDNTPIMFPLLVLYFKKKTGKAVNHAGLSGLYSA